MVHRFLGLTLSLLLCAAPVGAQTGTWHGELSLGAEMKLPLVFHLGESEGTLDSPAQGATGIPVTVSRKPDGEVLVLVPSLGAQFSGTWFPDEGRIEGAFSQSGLTLPLTLRVDGQAPAPRERPQTPTPPFPYETEEVSFSFRGGGEAFGTLVRPAGCDAQVTPAVLFVSGSGVQNRDEEVFGHKPFAVVADALARCGIASLRFDDRGYTAQEEGDEHVAYTMETTRDDACSGLAWLRERFARVGILGHSEGGTIALWLAADAPVDFAVCLAPMALPGKEALLWQNRVLLSLGGIPEDEVERYCALLEAVFSTAQGGQMPSDEAFGTLEDARLRGNLAQVAAQMESPWLQFFLSFDPATFLSRVSCPVLALAGELDRQLDGARNLEVLEATLPHTAGNTFKLLPGLNHLLQHAHTGLPQEYALLEETLSPEVLDCICRWIQETCPGTR